MEDLEAIVYLKLDLWLFVTNRMKEESRRRLQAARRNTLEKYRRVLEAIQQFDAEDESNRAAKKRREACGQGFYRPANESGVGCRQCPPNSQTHKDGSEMCECVPGFNRLSTDAAHLGCTRKDVDTSVSSIVNSSVVTVPPQQIHGSWLWLIVGGLLLTLILPITVLAIRQKNIKIRSEQDVCHLPINAECSWRRLEEADPAPPQIQTFSGGLEMTDFFADGLKNLVVDKNQITLGKVLGKGEFGSVYDGIFSPSERVNMRVAIKTIRVGIDSRAELLEFLKEAEIMKNFDHENVLRLLGVSVQMESDSSLPVPLLILPYMKHGDLRRFLIASRGNAGMVLSPQTLLCFITDICAGMDYLSANGILHRDLAARNCMVGDDLRVSVADFGLSKRVYSKNYYRQQVLIRLPIKWMSIESLSESLYSSKSDVWSFGVTMWEILSKGKTPYPGVQNHELLDLLRSGFRLKPPEECDHQLYEVMRSCWDKDPRARPEFSELSHTLRRLLLEEEEGEKRADRGQEVYMNLHAAPHTPRGENVYLCSPRVAGPEGIEGDDLEDGYMKCIRENTPLVHA